MSAEKYDGTTSTMYHTVRLEKADATTETGRWSSSAQKAAEDEAARQLMEAVEASEHEPAGTVRFQTETFDAEGDHVNRASDPDRWAYAEVTAIVDLA